MVNSKNFFYLLLLVLINLFFGKSFENSNEAIKRASNPYGGGYPEQTQQVQQKVQEVQQEVLSYTKIHQGYGPKYYGPHGIAQQVQQQVNHGGK